MGGWWLSQSQVVQTREFRTNSQIRTHWYYTRYAITGRRSIIDAHKRKSATTVGRIWLNRDSAIRAALSRRRKWINWTLNWFTIQTCGTCQRSDNFSGSAKNITTAYRAAPHTIWAVHPSVDLLCLALMTFQRTPCPPIFPQQALSDKLCQTILANLSQKCN